MIKHFLTFSILIFNFTLLAQDYQQSIINHREEKHQEFINSDQSPIKDKDSFKGLNYFPVDSHFNVTGKLEIYPGMKMKTFDTSSGIQKTFKLYGTLVFKLKGTEYSLPVYQSMLPIKGYEKHLFVPFLDQTTGEESYGAGRYLDLYIPENFNSVEIDFNKAYNPYCAYSEGYACPIPGNESFIDMAITAGEKNYNK
ncbi:DUF1684 domain-containing protein [Marinigracilibium pacificum]|uniref:DUF1684 domain-containing protein n=1 Tax=Marinigracilibium pacificum TaxID=2729599 RepID=A0A848IUX0_9BACT|nr:DUF1684 domain-containing protein [Marinigracilibium pacificum]NMM47085.1 DUF1684 domain-containing protein [Marinigracilibium pacificum]